MSGMDEHSVTCRVVGQEATAEHQERLDENFLRVAALCLQQTVDGPLGASRV